MISRDFKKYLPDKYKRIDKLKGLLVRSGNKERTNTFLLSLMQTLKTCANLSDNHNSLVSFVSENPLNTLGEKSPFKILDKCLYQLMPAFILRRTFRAGRIYNLPVPISDNRASFMASDWFRKSINTKTSSSDISLLMARAVGEVLHKKGSARRSLKNYIKIALDQRPFSRYIRKKRKIVARSKYGYVSFKLRKKYKKNKRIYRLRRYKKNRSRKRRILMRRFSKRKNLKRLKNAKRKPRNRYS